MPEHLSQQLKIRARELGFQLCGICPAVAPPGASKFTEWLTAGYAGKMHYLAERQEAYQHPRHVLEGARSIVMLGMNYATELPAEPQTGQGRVSRYAWGEADYHDLIRDRLHSFADCLRDLVPTARTRGVVDTAPLLEREFAQLAGLGWIGKNTLLLSKHAGSYFFLAALLTDERLHYDTAHAVDHCGTCTACLDACPTDAFVGPYVLDASRCISYLTIELQESIPEELRSGLGQWAFGCDVCQDVCPWNHDAPLAEESAFLPEPDKNPLALDALFELDDATFRHRFRHTPLWRSHRRGLLRNAAIVLGNQQAESSFRALSRGLLDEEPLVRGASAWALGQLRSPLAKKLLEQRLGNEKNTEVEHEVRAALAAC